MHQEISRHIFRAYDIRGIFNKDISPQIFYKIGCATGIYIKKVINGRNLAVGCDIRKSSPSLLHSFIAGVTAVGVDIIFTGTTSFGQTLFTGWEKKQNLISYITASHLPAEWNGVKFYYGDGVGLPEEELMKIRDLTLDDNFETVEWDKIGEVKIVDAKKNYHNYFESKFSFRKKIKVAIDCGGASMTLSAPKIFQAIGLDTVCVFCEPDPMFTQRPSDPKPKNLGHLLKTVKNNNCDFGVAFDGDGDRSVIVDNEGKILSADEVGIIIGKYGIGNKKGTVIVNVECSKTVKEQLEPLGFKIKQIPVGHTFLTLEAKRENAPLGIESSGHLIIPEYFLFDDAIVVPLRIAEILDNIHKSLSEISSEIPKYPTVKYEIPCDEKIKFVVIDRLKKELSDEYKNINIMDGIRIDLKEGWVLIRSSNTSPIIRLTAEADDTTILSKITSHFKNKTEETIKKYMKTYNIQV